MQKPLLLSALFYSSLLCAKNVPQSQATEDRVNYPANFQVEKGWNLFILGEYLYWTANEDGLYLAQSGAGNPTGAFPPDGSINFNGKIKKIDPSWDSGARLGIGLNFPKEGYDTILYWTWFSTQSHTKATHGNLIPLWAEPDFIPYANATSASGNWNLDLNVFDLEWGRSCWFGGHFSMRPFFGLRGLIIGQDLDVKYIYATTPAIEGHLHSDSDFKGGGLRAGADTRFALPHGFAVYGLASGSLLYGQSNADFNTKENSFTIAKTTDSFTHVISALQMGLGLGWDSHFAKERLHIEFHVGWESNLWFNVNQMNHFLTRLHQGSYFKENSTLSTQGLVAGGRFDF